MAPLDGIKPTTLSFENCCSPVPSSGMNDQAARTAPSGRHWPRAANVSPRSRRARDEEMLRKGERPRRAERLSNPLQPVAVETEVSHRGAAPL